MTLVFKVISAIIFLLNSQTRFYSFETLYERLNYNSKYKNYGRDYRWDSRRNYSEVKDN